MSEPKLKILFVASEAAPFVKVGGLGEVMNSLPKALRKLGHDARVLVPKYATIDLEKYTMKFKYPPPGKLVGMIHDTASAGKEHLPVITLGYLSDMIIMIAFQKFKLLIFFQRNYFIFIPLSIFI